MNLPAQECLGYRGVNPGSGQAKVNTWTEVLDVGLQLSFEEFSIFNYVWKEMEVKCLSGVPV